jgi:hypothetical protein
MFLKILLLVDPIKQNLAIKVLSDHVIVLLAFEHLVNLDDVLVRDLAEDFHFFKELFVLFLTSSNCFDCTRLLILRIVLQITDADLAIGTYLIIKLRICLVKPNIFLTTAYLLL